MLCRDRCGYCTFAKPPARLDAPYLTLDEVLDDRAARRRARLPRGAVHPRARRPEARYPDAAEWLAAHGYASTVDYLAHVARLVLDETGLLPHANAGALTQAELERLRPVSPSQGMMIETLAARLGEPGGPHHGAPDKTPERRLATLEAAGRARVPVHHRDPRRHRRDARRTARRARGDRRVAPPPRARAGGHRPELPAQAGTAMHKAPACPPDEFLWSIAAARIVLARRRAPAGAAEPERRPRAVARGRHRRLGRRLPGHPRPREPRAAVARARHACAPRPKRPATSLAPRLTIYPEYVRDPEHVARSRDCAPRCSCAPTAKVSRATPTWSPGRDDLAPPALLPPPVPAARRRTRSARCSTVCSRARRSASTRSSRCSARAVPRSRAIAAVADQLRREIVGDEVTFVRNRNINYTNVCTFKCRFCAFSKGPLSLNLRGKPYLLELEEMQRRVVEAVECGATEVCLQGGIHPDFDGDYYVEVARGGEGGRAAASTCTASPRSRSPKARAGSSMPLDDYLLRLKEAGLATLPGTAAEILDDEVRAIICPDKVEHRRVARRAPHRAPRRAALERHDHVRHGRAAGARRPPPRAHRVTCRRRPAASPSSCRCRSCTWRRRSSSRARPGAARPSARSCSMHAVGRIAYRGWIDNVQVSWVKCGVAGARQILQAGANDLGGTLMDENISRAAGASHGQELDEAEFRADRRADRAHRSRSARRSTAARRPSGGGCVRRTTPRWTVTVARRLSCWAARRTVTDPLSEPTLESRMSRVRRPRHRQRPRRRAEPRDRRVRRAHWRSNRGAMTLIDERPRRRALRRRWVPAIEISGGSAANTMVGRRVVRRARRVPRQGARRPARRRSSRTTSARPVSTFDVAAPRPTGRATGRCLIIVTPDAQRTMNTYLGASALLRPGRRRRRHGRGGAGRVPRGLPLGPARGQGGVPQGRAHRARGGQRGRRSRSPTRSASTGTGPSGCELVEDEVDILFANEDEICALYESRLRRTRWKRCAATVASPRSRGPQHGSRDRRRRRDARGRRPTRSTGSSTRPAPATSTRPASSTATRSGDDLETCARLGSLAAAEVISPPRRPAGGDAVGTGRAADGAVTVSPAGAGTVRTETVRAWIAAIPTRHHGPSCKRLLDAGDDDALASRFAGRLAFGTAGLRGALGARSEPHERRGRARRVGRPRRIGSRRPARADARRGRRLRPPPSLRRVRARHRGCARRRRHPGAARDRARGRRRSPRTRCATSAPRPA